MNLSFRRLLAAFALAPVLALGAAAAPARKPAPKPVAAPPPAHYRFAAGLLSTGLSAQYFPVPRLALGAQVQAQSGVLAFGLRQTLFINAAARPWRFFIGAEENRVDFDVDDVKGNGWTGGLFIGANYFFADRWSVQVDAGPAYLALEDDDDEVGESGLEFVANFGVNFHWGGR